MEMKIILRLVYRVTLSLTTIVFFSCSKLVEVAPPADKITRSSVFESDATAQSAMVGIYTKMVSSNFLFTSGGTTLFTGLLSDELYNSASSSEYDEFANNALSAGNSLANYDFWTTAYNIVYSTNSIIEGLQTSSGVSKPAKDELDGEALFIRSFVYFYLVNLYGDVPLILTSDYQQTAKAPRTSVQTIYRQITADLTTAKTLLANDFSFGKGERIRPTKAAAASLLARVYLYTGNWNGAENEATSVINNAGSFSLVSDLTKVFLKNSNEAIWQLYPAVGFNTYEGNLFIPAAGTQPAYPLRNALLSAFEVGDQRKKKWADSVTTATGKYFYPSKYKVKTATLNSEYYTVFRLAELYLIRAEARTKLTNLSGAISDLTVIRSRAGLPTISPGDTNTLLAAIWQESRIEFFAEWGHRWFDLKRNGQIDAVLSIVKSGWKSTASLLPIPLLEIQYNPSLTQNPGY